MGADGSYRVLSSWQESLSKQKKNCMARGAQVCIPVAVGASRNLSLGRDTFHEVQIDNL